jgi:hypothetical protein
VLVIKSMRLALLCVGDATPVHLLRIHARDLRFVESLLGPQNLRLNQRRRERLPPRQSSQLSPFRD